MRNKLAMTSVLLLLLGPTGHTASGQLDRPYQGGQQDVVSTRPQGLSQDLHLIADVLVSHRVAPGQHLLLCRESLTLAVAGRQYKSDRGMVWIAPRETKTDGGSTAGYQVQVYLGGRVSNGRAGEGQAGELTETVLERDEAVVLKTSISGEVFVTADQKETANPRSLPLYQEAIAAFKKAGWRLPPESEPPEGPVSVRTDTAEPNKPAVGYTVSIASLTGVMPEIVWNKVDAGEEIGTLVGRFYIWWQQSDEQTSRPVLYELEADNLVLWRSTAGREAQGLDPSARQERGISEIYVSGNIVLRQGQRTIYADEMYYDLRRKRALARNVVMRTFDTVRNVPIYVRAKQLRQLNANEFEGQDVVLTTSEFWTPQISLEAARIHVTDTTQEAGPDGIAPDSNFDVELKKVRFKYGNITLLDLPALRSTRERPDVPIRTVRVGNDRAYGTSIETRWYLSRILGLREPEGTDSELALDYYGDRGLGGGARISYEREDYFGSVVGYAIDDHGEDRLGRTRTKVEVPEEMRGRFGLQHRQFLPDSWQLTAEVSYLSDRNFLEQFYRTEFNVGKEQETLLYLKRIEDNWGLAFLGKTRINDFLDEVEELPTTEYHLTGQSLFDDRFTFFSDNQVSRYRYRFSSEGPGGREPDEYFTFTGTRNELDMPLALGTFKVVPFVAGTFGYEDGAGFQARINDGLARNEDAIWIGEAGVRASMQPYWCVYPGVESRLWDLHQLRHVIWPSITAVTYVESDIVAEQRNTLDLEIAQRLQTKRGPAGNVRTVDWLELNVDFVWVGDPSNEISGPDRFIWNGPFIPLVNRAGERIPPLDRRTTGFFGPRHDYTSVDAILRLTDTTSVLGDAYLNMQTGVVEQADVGFSRLCWPNLSYYVGSRYLRNVENGLGEKGSNAFTFAITYVLDPRYTLVFSEQFDFDYGANVTTDLTLIRKYHRMNLALTFGADESLAEQRFVLSLWPEGVRELAIGQRRYMGLGASDVYY